MKNPKKYTFIIIAIAFFVLLFIVYSNSIKIDFSEFEKSEEEITEIAKYYFDHVKTYDRAKLEALLYFAPEYSSWKEPILLSMQEDPPLAFEIIGIKKLGDVIYEVTTQCDTKHQEKQILKNYVVYIDHQWRYVINSRDVPPEIYTFASHDDTILF